jgi:hypothetical protein
MSSAICNSVAVDDILLGLLAVAVGAISMTR